MGSQRVRYWLNWTDWTTLYKVAGTHTSSLCSSVILHHLTCFIFLLSWPHHKTYQISICLFTVHPSLLKCKLHESQDLGPSCSLLIPPAHCKVSGTPKMIKYLLNQLNERIVKGVWKQLDNRWYNIHDICYAWYGVPVPSKEQIQ